MSDFSGSTTHPTAHKNHRCVWCGERIEKGQPYVRWAGKWDGDFQCNAYHPECYKAAHADGDCWVDGFGPYSFRRGSAEER